MLVFVLEVIQHWLELLPSVFNGVFIQFSLFLRAEKVSQVLLCLLNIVGWLCLPNFAILESFSLPWFASPRVFHVHSTYRETVLS